MLHHVELLFLKFTFWIGPTGWCSCSMEFRVKIILCQRQVALNLGRHLHIIVIKYILICQSFFFFFLQKCWQEFEIPDNLAHLESFYVKYWIGQLKSKQPGWRHCKIYLEHVQEFVDDVVWKKRDTFVLSQSSDLLACWHIEAKNHSWRRTCILLN